MASENTVRLAVLIDADNAQASITEGLLAEIAKYGTAHVKRAYGDWTAPNLRAWKDQLLAQSIQPIQQFAYTTGKNATDAAMVIDAAYLIDATGQIRYISIGEGDYTQEEQLIRQLLTAAHPGLTLPKATNVPDTTPTTPTRHRKPTSAPSASSTTTAAPPTRADSSRCPPASPRTPLPWPAPGPWPSSRSPQARTPRSGSPSTPPTSTWMSAAPARSPSPPAAPARSSAYGFSQGREAPRGSRQTRAQCAVPGRPVLPAIECEGGAFVGLA